MTTMRSAACAAVAVGLTVSFGLGGCTGKKDAGAAKDGAAATTAARPTLVAKPLPPDATFVKDPVGAAADVHLTACPTDQGKQTAKGTVKNSAKEKRDYAIMIIWLKNDNNTPMGSGMTLVRGVEPGAQAEWTVGADVIAKADTCTQNVKAGQLKS